MKNVTKSLRGFMLHEHLQIHVALSRPYLSLDSWYTVSPLCVCLGGKPVVFVLFLFQNTAQTETLGHSDTHWIVLWFVSKLKLGSKFVDMILPNLGLEVWNKKRSLSNIKKQKSMKTIGI
jgi:hypothetical protein